jgi:light-regulated signal transduction histidine kinase (bacteriophytochrome)
MTETDTMNTYKIRAEEVVERVARAWHHEAENTDLKALTDAVHYALVEEANLELRQILAQMGGQVEMAIARAERGQPAMTIEKMRQLLDGVQRADALMQIFLDRASAAKLAIRLDVADIDLGGEMREFLQIQNLADRVRVQIQPCTIRADRQKLMDALGHLVTRFYFASRPHEEVVVSLAPKEGHVEGFIGLTPSHLRPEQLMEEMHMPMNVEDIGIEVAYIRAILERHGGQLFVATAGESSAGFGFTLPLLAGGA